MTLSTEDTKSTFVGDAGATNQDIQPAAGEVWQVSLFAKVTAGGGAGDDLYLYLITDGADTDLIDSQTNNASAQVFVWCILISNDCYLRISHDGGGVGGNHTVTYWYQAFKVT